MKAEECLINHRVFYNDEKSKRAKQAMIEFAHYHVKEALKAASYEARIYYDKGCEYIEQESILNSYSKENIK